MKKLTAELEEERVNLEKMTKEIAAGPEVKELLEYMKQTPVFYHKVMHCSCHLKTPKHRSFS